MAGSTTTREAILSATAAPKVKHMQLLSLGHRMLNGVGRCIHAISLLCHFGQEPLCVPAWILCHSRSGRPIGDMQSLWVQLSQVGPYAALALCADDTGLGSAETRI